MYIVNILIISCYMKTVVYFLYIDPGIFILTNMIIFADNTGL